MIKPNGKVIPAPLLERRAIRCPKCYVVMSFAKVAGISVEKCPVCEGTFFDKGEVEHLIRRSIRFNRFRALRIFRWT